MESFRTRVIIEFDQKCSYETKKWLEAKISSPKHKNGSQFLVSFSGNSKNKVKIFDD